MVHGALAHLEVGGHLIECEYLVVLVFHRALTRWRPVTTDYGNFGKDKANLAIFEKLSGRREVGALRLCVLSGVGSSSDQALTFV